MPVGQNVCVIGGGLVGCELAEFLAERGRRVVMLEEGSHFATEMALPRRWRVLTDLREHGTTLTTGARVTRITEDAVQYELEEGGAQAVRADSVVIATGLIEEANRLITDTPAAEAGDSGGVTG